MFMFPEPAPLDYYITDVSPSFTADGVFYHGRPIATHKYVAKQLRPIKRTVLHPLAPIQELDSRTLDRRLAKDKELYVDPPQKDNGDVYKTLIVMPKWRQAYQRMQQSMFSIFPRSQQYELRHIQNKRLKDFENRRGIAMGFAKEDANHQLKRSICWKDEFRKPSSLPLGNVNDYTFEKFRDFGRQNEKKSPLKNQEETSTKGSFECADAFKLISNRNEPLLKSPIVEKRCVRISDNHPCRSLVRCELKADDDVERNDKKILNGDSRWYLFHDNLSFPKSDLQRHEELRKLTEPFSHDLHKWYSKNKPTKLITPLKQPGKKAMPEMRFSHL